MTTLPRFLLILAGLFVGLWLRSGGGALAGSGLPALALLALILAVAAAPRPAGLDPRMRTEEAFRLWLDAWRCLHTGSDRERAAAEQAFASASHALVLSASARVLKAIRAAAQQEYSPAAVAQVILEMRRSIGRPSLTLQAADLQALLAEPTSEPPARKPASASVAAPVSFLE